MKRIENGLIYDVNDKQFKEGTLIVENEKIKAQQRSGDQVTTRDEVEKIDASGCYITPGLIDASSQIGLKEMGVRWEGDDSYEPNYSDPLQLNVVDGIYPFDLAFEGAVREGVTSSHVIGSPQQVIAGQSAVIHSHGETADEMVIKESVGYVFSMGQLPKRSFFDQGKLPLTRMAVAKQIRDAIKTLKRDSLLDGKRVYIRCHRADDIATAIRIANECDIAITIVHATEVNSAILARAKTDVSMIAGPCFQPMDRQELMHLHPSLYKKIKQSKHPFTFGSDHPVSGAENLRLEGILALKQELSEGEILNGLTIDAAKILGVENEIGSLEEGKFADFVIWDKHPLSYEAKVKSTYIKGNEVYKELK